MKIEYQHIPTCALVSTSFLTVSFSLHHSLAALSSLPRPSPLFHPLVPLCLLVVIEENHAAFSTCIVRCRTSSPSASLLSSSCSPLPDSFQISAFHRVLFLFGLIKILCFVPFSLLWVLLNFYDWNDLERYICCSSVQTVWKNGLQFIRTFVLSGLCAM